MRDKYDIIIVGTGCAGLFTALCLKNTYDILLITKDKMENSDSYLAQGGICVLKSDDDYEPYFEDTLRAGHYKNNRESVKIMIESSKFIISKLIEYGVEFDKDINGNFDMTKEAAHSTNRIIHYKDITGKEITSKLINEVKKRKNIEISEDTTMVDIIEKSKIACGIVVNKNNNISTVKSKVTILATGGIGGIFKQSTNFSHITGDSLAIAVKHNVKIENINYIQIHPTTLYSKNKGRKFLISESIRGEGAILLNHDQRRFVDELLPRDVVATSICEEMKKEKSDHVFIKMEGKSQNEIKKRFPNIYKACLDEGYDLTKDLVPVTPAQHYLMGGIKSNTYGQTSMDNLFAVGETANNGVHGANRLASNSLLESLVFANRAAMVINEGISQIEFQSFDLDLRRFECLEELNKENYILLLNEIKREDKEFYDKWCSNEN